MAAVVPPPSPRMMRRLLGAIRGEASVREVSEALLDALGRDGAGRADQRLPGPETFRWRTPHAHIPHRRSA